MYRNTVVCFSLEVNKQNDHKNADDRTEEMSRNINLIGRGERIGAIVMMFENEFSELEIVLPQCHM